ncbi:MAG: DUF1653 domain-containing protein [Anaerolineaceae bacterium]|nr:MAG: DUF1653 domain-containing protein [Anaerolineaceae bacterium]
MKGHMSKKTRRYKMEMTPRPGEIFYLTKDKPYQIITIGIHKETCESMVIYQALYGEFNTFVLPLSKFLEEVQQEASKERTPIFNEQKHNNDIDANPDNEQANMQADDTLHIVEETDDSHINNKVNETLLSFLDADSYTKKLEVITTNIKALDNRLINDMAASLDCTVEDGPMDQRLQELIYCLKQLSRFEVKRLR